MQRLDCFDKKGTKNMKRIPVFIHSLFRTGSTYVWLKFRKINEYYCYYEPFHQVLPRLTVEISNIYDEENSRLFMRHPPLDKRYFFEYEKFLSEGARGVPYFKKSFIADEFCYVGDGQGLKRYIDFLISGAGNKIPVFQFNRSALRVKWFKEQYPESFNLYILRNPRDNWASCMSFLREGNSFFVTMDLLLSSINLKDYHFNKLSKIVPLFEYHDKDFKKELNCYTPVSYTHLTLPTN